MSDYWNGPMQSAGASLPQNTGQTAMQADYAADQAFRRLLEYRATGLEAAIRTRTDGESVEETVRRARVFVEFISGGQA